MLIVVSDNSKGKEINYKTGKEWRGSKERKKEWKREEKIKEEKMKESNEDRRDAEIQIKEVSKKGMKEWSQGKKEGKK